ncbi:glycosyltransferase family 8 protein [Paxillus involutus ATCC 200175]|uniref:Glycosyltransferase family 8 protein n=1 Tax=Paxillus involutus ATCC 200175 TaxID=664439 RepID=A0A0C9TWJ9_PAXIN|nr:glycosyltransferase family 8 protein [Paxillus involutus ATCC 200175]
MSTTDKEASTNAYEFTPSQDWFTSNISSWKNLFPFVTAQEPRALEIGSWEGRSAVFLLSTLCATGGELVCVDHFDLMETAEGRERYRKIKHNLALTGRPARVLPQFSVPALYTLLQEEMNKDQGAGFDWIYIDGSHRADDTLLDAELAWRLARRGCVFIFDDYKWTEQPVESPHHPRRGIDTFLTLHAGEYTRLEPNPEQYQMVLQKTTPMRIGFLLEGHKEKSPEDAFGYGINIALTIDSAYAMPAAVTLHSIIEKTQRRVTLYIVDCGLSKEDRKKIETSLPLTQDITLLFVELPPNPLTSQMGTVWAKIDMIKCLPVQRVLYLDADTLVCKDLGDLWTTDLQGRSLAAVPDVGCPFGHEGVPRGDYFNAGVLLIDLAKTRSRLPELEARCFEMKNSQYREQDALNVHFADDWTPMSLQWNAQGLGTYAECASGDRDKLRLEEMKDPGIVHFTGPVHPSLVVVLNPYVQPYTAKPWGYAGAPGHPFERKWWAMLERTAWKGWEEAPGYKESCEQAKIEALKMGEEEFENRLRSKSSI